MRTAGWWYSLQTAWEEYDPGNGIGGRWKRAIEKKKHKEVKDPTSD